MPSFDGRLVIFMLMIPLNFSGFYILYRISSFIFMYVFWGTE